MAYVKYPRTLHLPWSPGATDKDEKIIDVSNFEGKEVVVTVKYDGENFTLYHEGCHARSLDSRSHPYRDWIKKLQSNKAYKIPENIRICGEHLYARHTLAYENLKDYFLVFNIFNQDYCFAWDIVEVYVDLFGLSLVDVLYKGPWDEELIKNLYKTKHDDDPCEGYVIRITDYFLYKDFNKCVAKCVKKHIIEEDDHWFYKSLIKNKLRRK